MKSHSYHRLTRIKKCITCANSQELCKGCTYNQKLIDGLWLVINHLVAVGKEQCDQIDRMDKEISALDPDRYNYAKGM